MTPQPLQLACDVDTDSKGHERVQHPWGGELRLVTLKKPSPFIGGLKGVGHRDQVMSVVLAPHDLPGRIPTQQSVIHLARRPKGNWPMHHEEPTTRTFSLGPYLLDRFY